MNILFLNTPAFGKEDMIDSITELGHSITYFSLPENNRKDVKFEHTFSNLIETKNPNYVFSFNYFPVISQCCQKYLLPYLSFVYDSPLLSLFSCTILNPCNYIFIFDHTLYYHLHNGGIPTVYYLPLASNPKRLDQITPTKKQEEIFTADVSFVGAMYNEAHHLFERLNTITPYSKGYLDSIMSAQLKVSGYYFIEELLTDKIIHDLKNACPYKPSPDGIETDSYVYANYFIARKLAEIERTHILKLLSEKFQCRLYTHNPTPNLPNIINMGPVDHYEIVPYICKLSKINLNITLRSIQSGIPLRSWDILGAGGFLLSNYQADYDNLFIPDEDYVYYIDETDLLKKTDYYLSHSKERMEIAENGHHKVLLYHTYKHRILYMMNTAHLI